jgi:hypothetical protein
MSEFIPVEKGVPIRQPSTANLMVASADRLNPATSPWNFTIQKNASILNGFFTRIGLTEVVLDWGIPNVQATTTGNTFTVDLSGTTHTVTLGNSVDGTTFLTVEQCLDQIVALLNTAFSLPNGQKFEIILENATTGTGYSPQNVSIATENGADFTITTTALSTSLGFEPAINATSIPQHPIYYAPNLQLTKYVDIICNDLTYNQALKDGSTSTYEKNVICRWYMAYDSINTYDAYGFPILMGYTPFYLRRSFNPPKQIRWDPTSPLGNLTFQVYNDDGTLLSDYEVETSQGGFFLTLQASEV